MRGQIVGVAVVEGDREAAAARGEDAAPVGGERPEVDGGTSGGEHPHLLVEGCGTDADLPRVDTLGGDAVVHQDAAAPPKMPRPQPKCRDHGATA